MKKTKQEIIDEIRRQHEEDLKSLIEYLDYVIEGKPYEWPNKDNY